ncbi:DUF134 domain-containing protein [Saccharicrinis aurantiacus]|uniref:DUF134 domain-containing protein n=1 Tax=Saccharicrinis aurantiacus TaxID=1849719 RepID=UPI000839197B|nr:DUF134 domain-containing protein [Saccharicrinis aurantiacus]
MPRQRRLRKVVAPPKFRGFKPYGTSNSSATAIELLYEEYEALKLADYDMMNHKEASELMNVSRATFARIYESARRKMAQALVETREIKTVYGNAEMDESWHLCNDCHARFTIPPSANSQNCALCSSTNIESIKK